MMREVAWQFSKAHIWFDNLPDWSYEVIDVREGSREGHQQKPGDERSMAIELSLPLGDIPFYGALGATFIPQATTRLTTQFCVSPDTTRPCESSLAFSSTITYVGLPLYFAEPLMNEIILFDGMSTLEAGTLTFCRAIHDDYGSTIWIFRVLSRAIVRLLALDVSSLSDEELIHLLRSEIKSGTPPV